MANTESTPTISFGIRLTQLATEREDETAIVYAAADGTEQGISWRQFERRANQAARLFSQSGLRQDDRLVAALPNCPNQMFAIWAAWKLGATVVPIRWDLPKPEREALIELAEPGLVVGEWQEEIGSVPLIRPADLVKSAMLDDQPLPDATPSRLLIMSTGGSSGRPKLIAHGMAGEAPVGGLARIIEVLGTQLETVGGRYPIQLIAGPLYHVHSFVTSNFGLFEGLGIVLMERFDAERAVDLIERHKITGLPLVPIMMQRILKLPDIEQRDFSSVISLAHTGAPCPSWVKRGWIELIGPEKVVEVFGASEAIGNTRITGDEWLDHPGSVGRPGPNAELRILDDQGRELPTGEVGLISFRGFGAMPTRGTYIGAEPPQSNEDGFVTLGDLGWLDEDDYLYIADRRTDMIVSGGANIYPAEVEAALSRHPEVDDVVVIGLPDEEWGRRVHAIIQPADADNLPVVADLNRHVREQLARYKAPKTYEFMNQLPRNEAGKIRRGELVASRSSSPQSEVSQSKAGQLDLR